MVQFEYLVLDGPGKQETSAELTARIQAQAAQGWELVPACPLAIDARLLFIRRIPAAEVTP